MVVEFSVVTAGTTSRIRAPVADPYRACMKRWTHEKLHPVLKIAVSACCAIPKLEIAAADSPKKFLVREATYSHKGSMLDCRSERSQ